MSAQPGTHCKHRKILSLGDIHFLHLNHPGLTLEEAVALLELYLVIMIISFSWALYFLFVSKPVMGKIY